MAKNEKTEIGFEKFEEDFNAIPGTMFIEKSGETPEGNEIPEAKSLRWLALQFPKVDNPQDDVDRMQNCINKYCTDAADLINSQKAEIEKYAKEHDENFNKWLVLDEKTKKRSAELYEEAKGVVRAEAIREFAEKLKAKSDYCYLGHIDHLAYRISGMDLDSLVKEMTEGQDENKH